MKISHQQGDPASLTLLEENARFMPHETFQRLVDNIREDGVLQQWPFVWSDAESGRKVVLSGNHRVKAAMAAGLDVIDWTECDEPLSSDRRTAIQLAHNAIVGEDDITTLQRLYESIQDVSQRLYSGLNDASLDLMSEVDMTSLAEANLDFTTLMVVFLPEEYERAEEALDNAKSAGADRVWLARHDQHNQMLDALEDARSAAHIMNAATAIGVLLDVWDAHREDLAELWANAEAKTGVQVPVTSLLGAEIPLTDARRVGEAIRKSQANGSMKEPWEALSRWADSVLGEAR